MAIRPAYSVEAQTSLLSYFSTCKKALDDNGDLRTRMELIDRIYARELSSEQARREYQAAVLAGKESHIAAPTVPVVMPQVESALSDLAETFLASYPIFPVVAPPQLQEVALQIETLLANSAQEFQWVAQLLNWFRDGLKYPACALEIPWTEKRIAAVNLDPANGRTKVDTEALFRGTAMRRVDMYNFFCDRLVPPAEVHTRGEFAGYTELISRTELKRRLLELNRGTTMNATDAFNSRPAGVVRGGNGAGAHVYVPSVSIWGQTPAVTTPYGTDWDAWGGKKRSTINYANSYEWSVLYARIIPREHGIFLPKEVGPGGVPHIYKLVVINDSVIIQIERMTNAHDLLPIIVAQFTEDGLGWQTKSFAENAADYQNMSSALWTSGIEGLRRLVYDRMLYDPSRVAAAEINKVSPVARIAVKSEAYGKPLAEAVYQIPFRADGLPAVLQMSQQVADMADVANGQNRVDRGSFQKGNKTRTEFQETMAGSKARPRLRIQLVESRAIGPIKHVLRSNILQYSEAGELFNAEKQKQVKVDPSTIRKAIWSFQMADGAMPASVFQDPQVLQQAMQTALMQPAFAAEWDIMGMYAYSLQLQGARWIGNFRRTQEQQAAYMQQVQQTQQGAANGQNPPASPGA